MMPQDSEFNPQEEKKKPSKPQTSVSKDPATTFLSNENKRTQKSHSTRIRECLDEGGSYGRVKQNGPESLSKCLSTVKS